VAKVSPATEVGSAKGRSIEASIIRLPGKSYRTNTHAIAVPNKPLIKAARSEVVNVMSYVDNATGLVATSQNFAQPPELALVNIAAKGKNNIAVR
jgi:hypothetical protein